MEFTDYDTRLAAYAVIVDEADRMLLALRNVGPDPLWTLPGGGVELDETVEEAVVREVREETGYGVEVGPLLGIASWVVPAADRIFPTDRPMKSVRVLFHGTVAGGQLTHEIEGTTDEARWVPRADVQSMPRVRIVDTALRLLTSADEDVGCDTPLARRNW